MATPLVDRKCSNCACKLASVPADSPKAGKPALCVWCYADMKARRLLNAEL